jgi:hypothetical protein
MIHFLLYESSHGCVLDSHVFQEVTQLIISRLGGFFIFFPTLLFLVSWPLARVWGGRLCFFFFARGRRIAMVLTIGLQHFRASYHCCHELFCEGISRNFNDRSNIPLSISLLPRPELFRLAWNEYTRLGWSNIQSLWLEAGRGS